MRIPALAVVLVSTAAVARTESRQVPAFEEVHVSAGIRASVDLGSRRSVVVEADDDLLPWIETVVEDGSLRVGFKEGMKSWSRHGAEVKVRITTPALRSLGASGGSIVSATLTRSDDSRISASGGSEVHVRGLDAGRFSLAASGGSIVEVSGRTQSVELSLSGGSQLHGRDLDADDASVQCSGGSEGELRVARQLRGDMSGGSRLAVHGRPSSRVARSGGSEVALDVR